MGLSEADLFAYCKKLKIAVNCSLRPFFLAEGFALRIVRGEVLR